LVEIDTWNEDEYKFLFISPLFNIVPFKNPHFIPVKKLFAKKIVWKVGDILNLANFIPSNFRKPIIFGYKIFAQRPMSVKYANDTQKTEGLVEFMLAKGKQTPKKPHFFLHEYKPEKRRENDSLGQLLIAMVASQKINQDNMPVYGIYVNGRNWFFVILEDKNYAVSNAYNITDSDIYQLFAILQYIRNLMEDIYKNV
jgi:hypothetical protein